jgi:hypothetical protein
VRGFPADYRAEAQQITRVEAGKGRCSMHHAYGSAASLLVCRQLQITPALSHEKPNSAVPPLESDKPERRQTPREGCIDVRCMETINTLNSNSVNDDLSPRIRTPHSSTLHLTVVLALVPS